jgi:hypothetical protein
MLARDDRGNNRKSEGEPLWRPFPWWPSAPSRIVPLRIEPHALCIVGIVLRAPTAERQQHQLQARMSRALRLQWSAIDGIQQIASGLSTALFLARRALCARPASTSNSSHEVALRRLTLPSAAGTFAPVGTRNGKGARSPDRTRLDHGVLHQVPLDIHTDQNTSLAARTMACRTEPSCKTRSCWLIATSAWQQTGIARRKPVTLNEVRRCRALNVRNPAGLRRPPDGFERSLWITRCNEPVRSRSRTRRCRTG